MKNNIFQFIKAILLIIVSILLLVKPGESLVMLASYLGAISLIFGIISIINKYRAERKGLLSSKTYFEGLVAIAFGIIFLSNPENMIKLIVVFFGIMTFIVSIIQFSLYRNLEKSNIRSYFLLSTAILSMIIAFLMFFNPFSSAELLAMIIGSYVLVYGVILLLRAMRLFQDTI